LNANNKLKDNRNKTITLQSNADNSTKAGSIDSRSNIINNNNHNNNNNNNNNTNYNNNITSTSIKNNTVMDKDRTVNYVKNMPQN